MTTQPQANAEAVDPRFPSGPWTGFFLYPQRPGRQGMDLQMTFNRGAIRGEGIDGVGTFTIFGRYSDDGECRWTKEYREHDVSYRGFREGKGIWGVWEIGTGSTRLHGGFQIWPKGSSGSSEASRAEEEAPAPEVKVLAVAKT